MAPMVGSRTIKTLVALVASLAIGAFILILMETAPARPTVPLPLQAVRHDDSQDEISVVHQTDPGIEIQYLQWRNIVIHDTGRDGAEIASRCHLLIGRGNSLGDGAVQASLLWRRQLEGNHVHVPGFSYESNSIGICLLGDSRTSPPTPKQLATLVRLVRVLQVTCQIPRDHVYLHSELSGTDCPGGLFPAAAFRKSLIPPARRR